MITEGGRNVDLRIDSPAVIKQFVVPAVRRWRWTRVGRLYPELRSDTPGNGAIMQPIWKLLRSKKPDLEWGSGHKSALCSVICGRQWPQDRCFAAGFAKHSKSFFCLSDMGIDSSKHSQDDPELQNVPDGTLWRRAWVCPAQAVLRERLAPGGFVSSESSPRQPAEGY